MNKILWKDANIDKPATNDPVLVLTTNGCICTAQWDGEWWNTESGETFGNAQYFAEVSLPHGWNISDHYYRG